MWWFLLFIAALNIATGFGLAVILAGHCGTCPEAASGCEPDLDSGGSDFESLIGLEPEAAVASERISAAGEKAPEPLITSEPADIARTERDDAPAGNPALADLDAAVLSALGGPSLAAGPAEPNDEKRSEPPVDRRAEPRGEGAGMALTPGDELLRTFQSQLGSFCEELVALDEQLRNKPPAAMAELKSKLNALGVSNRKQDKASQDAEESLQDMIVAEMIDARDGEAVIAAIREERREAAETFRSFEDLESHTDTATQCEMVLNKTATLLDANYVLRDSVSDMVMTACPVGEEKRAQSGTDALTEVLSRIGLDGLLAGQWERDPDRVGPVSLVMIDLDHFGKLNRRRGAAMGDRVLRALAQLLKAESPVDCHVARFAGQRFAVLEIGRELKQAVSDAEHLRQIIETARFEAGIDELKITVSCGVVAVAADDTQASLYARAVESVLEAKRYGRNRCFVHEGEFPTPVVPPNLALDQRHVTL